MYYLKLAFKNIWHKKARTIFTSISIAVGVSSVLIISLISDLGRIAVNSELDHLGINGLMLTAKSEEGESVLSQSDIELLKGQEGVKAAIPIITVSGMTYIDNKPQAVLIWGIDAGADQIISMDVTKGNGLSDQDVSDGMFYALEDDSLGNEIGDMIQLVVDKETYNFKIKGKVMADSGLMQNLAGDYLPPIIYVPYTTITSIVEEAEIGQIAVKVDENSDDGVDKIGLDIRRKLQSVKSDSDIIHTENLVRQRNRLNNMLNIVTLALSAVGVVSLIVAGLSIMTIMMMSVNERTREIGIKRAMGAEKGTIIGEFIFETIIVCLIGSAVGLIVTQILAVIGNQLGMDINLSGMKIFITIILTISGGIIFGMYPAFLAARLDPTVALRKE